MKEFCENQWNDLCERTRRSAIFHAEKNPEKGAQISRECQDFCALAGPEWYPELLKRVSQARDLAVGWMSESFKADDSAALKSVGASNFP